MQINKNKKNVLKKYQMCRLSRLNGLNGQLRNWEGTITILPPSPPLGPPLILNVFNFNIRYTIGFFKVNLFITHPPMYSDKLKIGFFFF